MRDKTDEEIKAEREAAVAMATDRFGKAVVIIDSFFEGAPHDAKPLWFIGKSLQLLSAADCVYFCKGWENYRGCIVERTCAALYGVKILEG